MRRFLKFSVLYKLLKTRSPTMIVHGRNQIAILDMHRPLLRYPILEGKAVLLGDYVGIGA